MTTDTQGAESRHARLWYGLGAMLILVVVIASLVPARDLPHLRVSDKTEHFVAYFGLALGGGIGVTASLAGLRYWVRWLEPWPRRL